MSQRQEKRAEDQEDPQTQAELYQLLLQQVTHSIFITSSEGRLLDANLPGCQLLGYTHEELICLSWQDLQATKTSDRDPLSPHNLTIGQPASGERQLRRQDDELILVNIQAHQLTNGNILWNVHERSSSQNTEEILPANQDQLALVTDAIPTFVSYMDSEGRYQFVNRAYEEWSGQSKSELKGQHLKQVLGTSVYQTILPYVKRVLAGEPLTYEMVLPHEDRPRHVQAVYIPDKSPDGQVRGYFALVNDITLYKQAEATLKTNQAQLTGIIQSAMDAIISVDVQQRIVLFNAAAEQMFGCSASEALGQPLDRFIPERFRQTHHKHIQAFGETGVTNRAMGTLGVIFGQRLNGEEFPIEASISQIEAIGSKLFTVILRDITERQQAEEALRINQARMTGIVESAMDAIISVDADQRIILFNAAAEQMFGCSAAEALGQPLDRLIPERFRQRHQEHIQTFGQTGVTNRDMGTLGVIFGQRLNGEEFPIEASISQIEAAGAKLFTVILRDVTERRQAEDALLESQERLQMALSATEMGVWEWDLQTDKFFWSSECFVILGLEGYNETLTDFTEIVHPEDVDYVLTKARLAVINHTTYETEFRIFRPDGEVRWMAHIGQARYDKEGEPLRLVGTMRDITERKQSEEALRRSEARFRSYFELGLVGVAITSPTKGFLEVNDQMCTLLGYNRHELLQMSWAEITHPDDLALSDAPFARLLAGESDGYSLEKRWLRKDGEVIHSMISVKCVRNADGSLNYLVGLLLDITERKKAEEKLQYQASLLQNVSDAIIATDRQFTITSWNRGAEMIYGWSAGEVLGRRVDKLLGTEYEDDESGRVLQQFLEGGSWQGEVTQRHKNGSRRNIMASTSMIRDSSGDPMGVVSVNRDITERKEAEEAHALLEAQLQQAQKMESIGQLAGGVAHDFNNMLTVIQMYSELIRSRLPVDHPLIEKIDLIRSASQRSSALTRQLLAFSRQQMLAPEVLDLNSLITDLLKMVGRLIGEDITLSSLLQPGLWPITADPGQIEQVIMNLVVNARDAMPTGGMLTIETRNVQLDKAYARTHLEVTPGPFVLLTVTDTGHGMDRQTQSRIFEPFFTTKERDKGTGLGLATVHGIVKQSGGNILVYSEPDKGTTFKLYFPADKDVAANLEVAEVQARNWDGSETILLVEDEAMVRELVQGALQDLGYTVLVAPRGDAALSLVEHYSEQIDLLLTDVIMPRMSGRELAEQVQLLRPQIKVLFMSGYTDDAVIRHGLLMAEVEFLHKPFSPVDLAAKVRQVLDKRVEAK